VVTRPRQAGSTAANASLQSRRTTVLILNDSMIVLKESGMVMLIERSGRHGW
jgi:hypothetical protein